MQNGITLIALVISIIVMLILAGVSINSIVGDNGILSRTQYSTFLSEMTAVEEAVQMWKASEVISANGEETKLIPANKLCQAKDLKSAERLVGEIGYYRIWSMSEKAPEVSVFTNPSEFNRKFESEMIFFPAGIQDLYYLNNEAIGIKEDKTYVIDAATGMIYSMAGVTLKGVSCYSANMATAVMSGNLNAPVFAEAEVSGAGSGEKLAGNTEPEFLPDGTKNPDYKEFGFQIIASPISNNIFKLYNDGTLYGKGVKGVQLNNSKEEMQEINKYIWQEYKFPNSVGTISQTIMGMNGSIYYINTLGELWCLGDNRSNKFGLDTEQQKKFTPREAVKAKISEKVVNVYPGYSNTFVVTSSGNIYGAGRNIYGELGVGDTNSYSEWKLITIKNSSGAILSGNDIKAYFSSDVSWTGHSFFLFNDGSVYFAGNNKWGHIGNGVAGENLIYSSFTRIWDGNLGDNLGNDIKQIFSGTTTYVLKNDGTLWVTNEIGSTTLKIENNANINKHYGKVTDISGVESLYEYGTFITKRNGSNIELYSLPHIGDRAGSLNNKNSGVNKINLPADLASSGIKEFYIVGSSAFALDNSGNVWASGNLNTIGVNDQGSGVTESFSKVLSGILTLYPENFKSSFDSNSIPLFKSTDGKLYSTGNDNLLFGNDILQQTWKEVAKNVKYFDAWGTAYVDKNDNLYVAGDSRMCGMGDNYSGELMIQEYTLCPDSNIANNVKEVHCTQGNIYVLDNDGGLWATGFGWYKDGVSITNYPGWDDPNIQNDFENTKLHFVKLLDNVAFFSGRSNTYGRFAITNDGKGYGWGYNYGNVTGGSGHNKVPTNYTLPSTIGGASNIKKVRGVGWQRSWLLTNTGELFKVGNWTNGHYDGGLGCYSVWTKVEHPNMILASGEKVIEMAPYSDAGAMWLTSNSRVFGYGNETMLGIGSDINQNREVMELTDYILSAEEKSKGITIQQLVAGPGCYILIKSDGTVWGTGANTYGILGRWKNANRSMPNSRYQTAIDWVECPELEI